jgi:hypothetical protein
MPIHYAIALALFMLVAGTGLSWSYFREHLALVEQQLDDNEADLRDLADDRDTWQARAIDAEKNLELLLKEGDRDPLAAPIQVIAGGAL